MANLFEVLDQLNFEQLKDVAKALRLDPASKTKGTLILEIRADLNQYCRNCRNIESPKPFHIVGLWRKYTIEFLGKKDVKTENQALKGEIITQLENLISPQNLDDSEKVEVIVRGILLLQWQETSAEDRKRFVKTVKEDLKDLAEQLTEEEIEKAMTDFLLGGTSPFLLLLIPIFANIMLKRLTQGLIAWFAIVILGRQAAQVALLGALAGPIGWGIAGVSIVAGAMTARKSWQQRDKLCFIQAIFYIYVSAYQNRLQRR